LSVARENPTVIRLANGEILVAGGLDVRGGTIPTLEWFSPDASRASKRPTDLVTGRDRAFVPLEAGGALAVIRPRGGAADFKTVWVISADGTLEPAQSIDPSVLDTIRLFPGAEGAPALWTGRRWMRWSPWFGRFDSIVDAPDAERGGSSGPALDVIASGDSGLALWLDARDAAMNVVGFRFATRTPFGTVPKPLLVRGTEHFAPDRLASDARSSIRFEPALGLVLGTGASAFLTDLTFADFEAELDVTSDAPVVVLRPERGPELEIGGASCAFAQTARQSLLVNRNGRQVTVRVDGAPARACPVDLDPGVRVSLGLRGSQGAAFASGRNLRVIRR